MKNILIAFAALVIVGGGLYFITQRASYTAEAPEQGATDVVSTDTQIPVEPNNGIGDGALPLDEMIDDTKTVIGQSVNGVDIVAYHYGEGDTELLFVGGIHAGYSWNTVLVAYELMDYLASPRVVPEGVRVTVIPSLNPDGQEKVLGTTGRFLASAVPTSAEATVAGRFNARNVDLNRNFDCDWQSTGVWQNTNVSGGTSAFSEPEAAALRDYVASHNPEAVVAYYAAAGGVFASSCHTGVLPQTETLTNLYANAAGYTAYKDFDFYEVTGDMVNWLAKEGIPAISVLLTTHNDVEWGKNKAGVDAMLDYYAK